MDRKKILKKLSAVMMLGLVLGSTSAQTVSATSEIIEETNSQTL